MFLNIGVLKNFLQVFSREHCKIFKNTVFQFDKVTVQYRASADLLFLIKNNVGWFPLKRFVDLFRVGYVISRKHFNTFLLINLQKTKSCLK